jgi:chorismate mutase
MTDAQATATALATLRASFDEVDAQLVALLAQRARLAQEAGALKRAHGLPIVDEDREARAAAARADLARRHGVDEALVHAVFASVVLHSRRLQGAPA